MIQRNHDRIFNGEWWSVRLPSGWTAEAEEHGASFFQTPRQGTLQISGVRKSDTEVSDNDLKEFAQEREAEGHKLERTNYQAFSGFQCIREDGGLAWHEWWLKFGELMIYATYVVPTSVASETETREVIAILESLSAR